MKYFSILLILFLIMGSFYLWDASQRYKNISVCPSAKEIKAFATTTQKTNRQQVYQKQMDNPAFKFPRQAVKSVKLIKNTAFIGRLLGKDLTNEKIDTLLNFLNQPENYNWQKPHMRYADSDYILIFYNHKGLIIGKIWFCHKCHQLITAPFSPRMKYGCLKPQKAGWLYHFLKTLS